jgi:predicted DNA-binding transcriptional regulator AlpA
MSRTKPPLKLQQEPASSLEDHYYTSRELSGILNLSMSTLAGYRRRGTGPKYIALSYRNYRYPQSEVTRYLEEMTRASTSATRNYDL